MKAEEDDDKQDVSDDDYTDQHGDIQIHSLQTDVYGPAQIHTHNANPLRCHTDSRAVAMFLTPANFTSNPSTYTVSQKNWATFIFTVTLANVGRFFKFFQCRNQKEMAQNKNEKFPTVA